MKVNVLNLEGKKTGELELNNTLFGQKANPDLIATYIRVYTFNKRQGTAETKTRGEVSGGGRKPWRQKGTGRARQGSIRSPIWVGGGIAHGPKPKDWALKISEKMRRGALFNALSQKVLEEGILVLEDLGLGEIKTKRLSQKLSTLSVSDKKVLLVLPEMDKNVILSARNLPDVETIQAKELNAYAVISHDVVILPKRSIDVMEETFLEKNFRRKIEFKTIEELGLSKRTSNALQRGGIKTVEELKGMDEEALRKIKGLGKRSLEEIGNKFNISYGFIQRD